jgi:hypothetical protein
VAALQGRAIFKLADELRLAVQVVIEAAIDSANSMAKALLSTSDPAVCEDWRPEVGNVFSSLLPAMMMTCERTM